MIGSPAQSATTRSSSFQLALVVPVAAVVSNLRQIPTLRLVRPPRSPLDSRPQNTCEHLIGSDPCHTHWRALHSSTGSAPIIPSPLGPISSPISSDGSRTSKTAIGTNLDVRPFPLRKRRCIARQQFIITARPIPAWHHHQTAPTHVEHSQPRHQAQIHQAIVAVPPRFDIGLRRHSHLGHAVEPISCSSFHRSARIGSNCLPERTSPTAAGFAPRFCRAVLRVRAPRSTASTATYHASEAGQHLLVRVEADAAVPRLRRRRSSAVFLPSSPIGPSQIQSFAHPRLPSARSRPHRRSSSACGGRILWLCHSCFPESLLRGLDVELMRPSFCVGSTPWRREPTDPRVTSYRLHPP